VENRIIKRKKFWPTVWFLFSGFGGLMFFYACIIGITKRNLEFWFDYIFLVFFLILSIIIVVFVFKGFITIYSSFPAFEVNQKEIVVYHISKFDKLPFNEMIESKIYSTRYSLIIGISFKPNSKHGNYLSNFRRKIRNIPKEKSKILFLNMEFAEVKATELSDLINKMIEFNKVEKRKTTANIV